MLTKADPLWAGRGIKHLTRIVSSSAQSKQGVAIFIFIFTDEEVGALEVA